MASEIRRQLEKANKAKLMASAIRSSENSASMAACDNGHLKAAAIEGEENDNGEEEKAASSENQNNNAKQRRIKRIWQRKKA